MSCGNLDLLTSTAKEIKLWEHDFCSVSSQELLFLTLPFLRHL